jgi:cytochrome c peroxidase
MKMSTSRSTLAQGHLAAIDTAAITSEMSVLGRFLTTRRR